MYRRHGAHAFLAIATAAERDHASTPAGLIPLTVNEFGRLFDALLLGTKHTIVTLPHWSTWRLSGVCGRRYVRRTDER